MKKKQLHQVIFPASGSGTSVSFARVLIFLLACGAVFSKDVPALCADTVAYKTVIVPTGQADLDTAIAASSTLQSLQKTKSVGPFALAGRIRGDYERVRTALESFGYYAGSVELRVSRDMPAAKAKAAASAASSVADPGIAGDDPNVPAWLDALPSGATVVIRISAHRGALFRLGTIAIRQKGEDQQSGQNVALSAAQSKAFALSSGQPAIASEVLAAQARLQSELLEEGHALAVVDAPTAFLRPTTQALDLDYPVVIGPRVDIGSINLDGLTKVHQKFIRARLMIRPGQLYQPSKIEAARQDLASIGVFSDVGVHNGKALASDGTMPLDFTFHESKRHTVGAEAGYSTDLGGRAGVNWTHHNIFGNAEQLKLTALITGLGGSAQQGIGYDFYADLLKPDFLSRKQNISLRVEGLKQLFYSYQQTALLVKIGITRQLSRRWNMSYGLSAEQEQIIQFGTSRDYTIMSAPLGANFDSTDAPTPIDPATHGVRLSVNAAPSVSLGQGTHFFTILQATGSTYFDLANFGIAKAGRSVIAVRGIVGSVQGTSTFGLPPDQRLYAGGSATIRGFRYQGVGPQFAGTKYAIGGTSLDAASVEFRQRLFKSFGAAAFADAGQVGTGSRPFQGDLRVGVGGGVRYFTPIGPVRLDIAVPVNRPPRGDKWELYIGLGESF